MIMLDSMSAVVAGKAVEEKDTCPVETGSTAAPLQVPKLARNAAQELYFDKLHEFRSQRDREARHRVFQVGVRGGLAFAVGASIYTVGYLISIVVSFAAGSAIMICSIFILTSGLVAVSTCPSSLLDADATLIRKHLLRVLIGLGCTLMSFGPAFINPAMCVPAVFGMILVVSGYSLSRILCRPTTIISLWLMSHNVVWGLAQLWSHLDPDISSLTPVRGTDVARSYGFIPLFCVSLLCVISMAVPYTKLRLEYSCSAGARGLSPTAALYYLLYVNFGSAGIKYFVRVVLLIVSMKLPWLVIYNAFAALGYLVPLIVWATMGRARLFNIVARQFDQSAARRVQDGAFVASLLDSNTLEIGQGWWVHRKTGEEDPSYAVGDPRRNWHKGIIVNVGTSEFAVKLSFRKPIIHGIQRNTSTGSGTGSAGSSAGLSPYGLPSTVIHYLPVAARNVSCEQLLKDARRNLRCIQWENITKEFMVGAICGVSDHSLATNQLFALSRPLENGEEIDFFMSHSWHDDPEAKWDALQHVAEQFKIVRGRYPTFWLDKFCIDQQNIGDGLRALPVSIMECRKVLVLCGDTYARRLWCIWELFILFTFTSLEVALSRVVLRPLADSDCEQLSAFHLYDAHCYDPNEEEKLRLVIATLGSEVFVQRVRALSKAAVAKMGTQMLERFNRNSISNAVAAFGSRMYVPSRQSSSDSLSSAKSDVNLHVGALLHGGAGTDSTIMSI